MRTVAPSKMINTFNDAGKSISSFSFIVIDIISVCLGECMSEVSARVSKSKYSKVSESLGALLTKSFTDKTSTKGSTRNWTMFRILLQPGQQDQDDMHIRLQHLSSIPFLSLNFFKGTEITFSMTGGTAFSISVNKVNQGHSYNTLSCEFCAFLPYYLASFWMLNFLVVQSLLDMMLVLFSN